METELSENAPTTEQNESSSDEASGRWIRDQLRDVADSGLKNLESAVVPSVETPPAPQLEAEPTAMTDLVEGLAASISSAVAAPIRSLELRRSAEHSAVERALREQEAAGRSARERIESLAEQLRLLDESLSANNRTVEESRHNSEALGARISAVEESGLADRVQDLNNRLGDMAGRLESAERALRAQAEIVRSLEESERRRRESSRHLGELLDRMRETVTTMEASPRIEDTSEQSEAHAANYYGIENGQSPHPDP